MNKINKINTEIITLLFIIAALITSIVLLSITFKNKNNNEPFAPVNTNVKLNQPLAFENELLTTPCKPWVGCLYPMPNPINIKTGKRDPEHDKNICKEAWRDCPAYADCVNGKCKPKDGIYNGF